LGRGSGTTSSGGRSVAEPDYGCSGWKDSKSATVPRFCFNVVCEISRRTVSEIIGPVYFFVYQKDPDRFVTALFAPARSRTTLMTLYAFNAELKEAQEMGINGYFYWWREVLQGEGELPENLKLDSKQPWHGIIGQDPRLRMIRLAGLLRKALDEGRLTRSDLLALADAANTRDFRFKGGREPDWTWSDWLAWVGIRYGGLAVAAARALGASNPEEFRGLGAAYGIVDIRRETFTRWEIGGNLPS